MHGSQTLLVQWPLHALAHISASKGGSAEPFGSQTSVTSQLVALPLDTSWSVHSPPWKLLALGNANENFVAVATMDSKPLLTFMPQYPLITLGKYDIEQNSWIHTVVETPEKLQAGFRAVVDPDSGLIYIAGKVAMNLYDPQTTRWVYQAIPKNAPNQRVFGGAVYNNARRTIMYLGGYSDVFEPQTYIIEYSITLKTWSMFYTIGDIPPPIADHCMTARSLYLLDVPSRIWKKATPLSPRARTSCLIVGDQFLSWGGGDDGMSVIPEEAPVVYDLTKRQWVDTYTAPAYYPAAPSNPSIPSNPNTPDNSNNPNTSTTSNLGAILGGVLGSLLIIGLSVGIYVYRNRRLSTVDWPTGDESSKTEIAIPMAAKNDGQDNIVINPERRGPQGILSGSQNKLFGKERLPGPQGGLLG
ncbi:hypothetical protein BGZ65_006712 [Modicella reniformis]|uniref:Kelch repeat protein n=1 Tax=Modicella reniformis TaxID=1440133 RepID=A0A9P6MFQ4_9FUNG|nr:hypothetical protein BGZ65_006712 [Modicella reniformis]